MTITNFLLARIAEDEERLPSRASLDSTAQKRARAECAAKRRIVEHYHASTTAAAAIALFPVLTVIAAVYADASGLPAGVAALTRRVWRGVLDMPTRGSRTLTPTSSACPETSPMSRGWCR